MQNIIHLQHIIRLQAWEGASKGHKGSRQKCTCFPLKEVKSQVTHLGLLCHSKVWFNPGHTSRFAWQLQLRIEQRRCPIDSKVQPLPLALDDYESGSMLNYKETLVKAAPGTLSTSEAIAASCYRSIDQ